MAGRAESREYNFYRKLMREPGKAGADLPADYTCRGCGNHRPHWKYRFCVHTECPKMKGFMTFREKFYENGGEDVGHISC